MTFSKYFNDENTRHAKYNLIPLTVTFPTQWKHYLLGNKKPTSKQKQGCSKSLRFKKKKNLLDSFSHLACLNKL